MLLVIIHIIGYICINGTTSTNLPTNYTGRHVSVLSIKQGLHDVGV
jgi:hypothetical protein